MGREGSSYRNQKESGTKVTLREMVISLGGRSQPHRKGSKKLYPSLTSCSLSPCPDPLETKRQENLLILSGQLPPRAVNRRQKTEVAVIGKRTLFILCFIHHWSLDTLNTFMNGCTDPQFSMLYCFIHNDALKYFLAERLH